MTGVRSAVALDIREAPLRRRVLLVAVAAWIAYEWGIGNETVTPWLLVRVMAAVDGPMVIPATAAVGFAFTAVQQFVAGVTALAGFVMFDRTATAAWTRLRDALGREPTGWSHLGLGGRSLIVFTLGTTAVALIEVTTSGAVGVARHVRVVAAGALLCAALVAIAGGAAATIAWAGREIEPLAGPTDAALRVLGNPLLWLTVLAVYAGFALRRSRRRQPPRPTVHGTD